MLTKPVIRNGHKNMDEFRDKGKNSVIEADSLACSRVLPNHEWADFTSLMHDHDLLQKQKFDINVQCIVQRAFSWHSAPTQTNADLVIEGRMLETYGRVTDVVLESTFKIPMSKTFPPGRFFLTAHELVSAMNQRSGRWQTRADNLMHGWEIGGQPELPVEDNDLMNIDPECGNLAGREQVNDPELDGKMQRCD